MVPDKGDIDKWAEATVKNGPGASSGHRKDGNVYIYYEDDDFYDDSYDHDNYDVHDDPYDYNDPSDRDGPYDYNNPYPRDSDLYDYDGPDDPYDHDVYDDCHDDAIDLAIFSILATSKGTLPASPTPKPNSAVRRSARSSSWSPSSSTASSTPVSASEWPTSLSIPSSSSLAEHPLSLASVSVSASAGANTSTSILHQLPTSSASMKPVSTQSSSSDHSVLASLSMTFASQSVGSPTRTVNAANSASSSSRLHRSIRRWIQRGFCRLSWIGFTQLMRWPQGSELLANGRKFSNITLL